MRLKATAPLLNGWTAEGRLTTEHCASRHGQPVLVVAGEPYGRSDARAVGFAVIEATPEEREALRQAGYDLLGM